jgi:hypothetical protein
MDSVVVFTDGKAHIISEGNEPEEIVIYCDLCNEPIAITPVANDEVFLQCLRCHAVNGKP